MCAIFSNILILVTFALCLIQVLTVPILETGENNLESSTVGKSLIRQKFLFSKIDPNIEEDAHLETVFALNIFYKFKSVFDWLICCNIFFFFFIFQFKPDLITKYGYNVETHHVTTEDGYILQFHRISGGPKSPPRPGKKVCFYMHGIFDSSAGLVLSGPKNALGIECVILLVFEWILGRYWNVFSIFWSLSFGW